MVTMEGMARFECFHFGLGISNDVYKVTVRLLQMQNFFSLCINV